MAEIVPASTVAGSPGRHPSSRLWLRVWIPIAVAFTAMMVNYSTRHGPLLIGPWQDVQPLTDALDRVRTIDTSGLWTFGQDYIGRPPASPALTFLAVCAYLIFGSHAWAPYLGCGALILLLLLGIDRLTLGRPPMVRLALAAFALSLPLCGLCIIEFRPDAAAGLTTALALVFLLAQPLAAASRSRRWCIGMLLGAALLFTPYAWQRILSLTVVAGALQLLITRVFERESLPKLLNCRIWLPIIAPIGAVAIVLYGFLHRRIPRTADYFVLTTHGSLRERLAYYLTGAPGRMAFGSDFLLVLFLLTAGTLLALWRRSRAGQARVLALAVVTFIAFATPTFGHHRGLFSAAIFHFLILLAGVLALREMFDGAPRIANARPLAGRFVKALAWALVALMVARPIWPFGTFEMVLGSNLEASTPLIAAVNRIERGAYQCIAANDASLDATVFLTGDGYGISSALRYFGKADMNDLNVVCDRTSSDAQSLRAAMESASVIVASDPGTGLVSSESIPPERLAQTLEMARSLPRFRLVRTIAALGDKNFYVFARSAPFDGFQDSEGLGHAEGPYPAWRLPLVRWGMAPKTSLMSYRERPGAARISIAALTRRQHQKIDVIVNGVAVASWPLTYQPGSTFANFTAPIDLRAGRNTIELQYAPVATGENPNETVLFKDISIDAP